MPIFKILATNIYWLMNFWNVESKMPSPATYPRGDCSPLAPGPTPWHRLSVSHR